MKSKDLTKEYGYLKAGSTYKVIKSFFDYDNNLYEIGDTFTFNKCHFVPYENGLSLFCTYKGREKQIRLQVRPEAQQEIAHNLEEYVLKIRK